MTQTFNFTTKLFFILVALFATACDPTGPAPSSLTVEDRIQPLAVDDSQPEFAWELRSLHADSLQKAYQIQVATSCGKLSNNLPDLWDSRKTDAGNNFNIPYQGKPLLSRQKAFWRVRTWDSLGNKSAYSPCDFFEMGLLHDSDWQAKWICRHEYSEDDYSYFRKPFALPAGQIRSARLYLSVTHQGVLHINGRRAGRAQPFAPGEHPLYNIFAIEKFLKAGEDNVVGVLAHWYGAGQGRPLLRPGMIAQLEITYENGESVQIGSDSSWKTLPAEWYLLADSSGQPVKFINDEGVPAENINGQNHPAGWDRADFIDTSWVPALEIGKHPVAPWLGRLGSSETEIVETEISPVNVWQNGPTSVSADFGKVYAGAPLVEIHHAQPGNRIMFSEGYRLDHNKSVVSFAQKTDMRFEYLPRGGKELFRPFWYLGFRYLQISGIPPAKPLPDIKLVTRHARMPQKSAQFKSSDALLNQIWELASHSALYSAQEQFVDTPTREQAQFVYDGYLISSVLSWLYNERDLTQQALLGFAESQNAYPDRPGKLDAVYPNGSTRQDIGDWSMVWLPWLVDYYMESGDLELVKNVYPAAERTARWIERSIDKNTGLIFLGRPDDSPAGLVDWPDRYEYDTAVHFSTIMSLNAWVALSSFARLSQAVGNESSRLYFTSLAAQLLSSIDKKLWNNAHEAYSDGLLKDTTQSPNTSQQTNAMFLALNLVPVARKASVLKLVKEKGFLTSVIMARFLVGAYGESGDQASLFNFLRNPDGLNYAAILKDGATFTYENWRGRLKETESSESHGMGSYAAMLALRRFVSGVTPLAPAYKRVLIKPQLFDLKNLSVSIPTPQGQLEILFNKSVESFTIALNIPANMTVDLELPEFKRVDLKSGSHNFKVR